jgi:Domain of unknown function (DUF4189)
MVGKWLILGGVVLASFMYGSAAKAEGRCPPGYFPIGDQSVQGCAPIPGYERPSPRPNPGPRLPPPEKPKYGYGKEYGNSYIAIVRHPKATDIWATWNHRTEQKAMQTALNACTQTMKTGCVIYTVSQNQVVAIVRDSDNELWKGGGKNARAAQESALILCQQYSKGKGCGVLHTFASEPLKQPKIRDKKKYLNFLEDSASDVSQSYFPDRAVGNPVTSGKILFSDPQVGVWSMLSAGDGTGKNCAVAFTAAPNGANTVLFSGPTVKGTGAILFQGTGIPATNAIKEIRPTLTFKGAQPTPINAALVPQGSNSGILVLTDMVNMMRQTNTENEVTLQLDGKEVFRGSMTGFMKARSAMIECMKAG